MDKKASILLISLWTLAMLSAFAVLLGNRVRQQLELVRSLEARNKLHYIAEAGVVQAQVEISRLKEVAVYALKDEWSSSEVLFKGRSVGDGTYSISYDVLPDAEGKTVPRYGMVDEERRININRAEREVLERLLRVVLSLDETEAQNLAVSIIDWRDADSELTMPLGSAEDSSYRTGTYPYEAKDAEFQVLEELLLVKGFSQNIFDKLKDYITIYGSGRVNLNTASWEVLVALGLDAAMADQVLLIRSGKDGVAATADDYVFTEAGDLSSQISQSFSLSPEQLTQVNAVASKHLATGSKHFRVCSTARLNKGRGSRQIECVIDAKGTILSYQEF